jgi:hypothetical protein
VKKGTIKNDQMGLEELQKRGEGEKPQLTVSSLQ